MPSDRKVAANRKNAQRSTGPRASHAKKRISRNALRHGLAAIVVNEPGISAEVRSLAHAICAADGDPAQYEQAMIIAECELILLRVRATRANILEDIFHAPILGDQLLFEPALSRARGRGSGFNALTRLDRYERRAFSRRARAIRRFSVLAQEQGAAS
jgi:hypothetical protein